MSQRRDANQKKQDLLLDALSAIDEEVLARGLALREQKASLAAEPTAQGAERAPAPTARPWFDLTTPPPKPPRRSFGRVCAVVAAACLLVTVVPLSMWLTTGLSHSYEAPNHGETMANGSEAEVGNATVGGEHDGIDGAHTENSLSPGEAVPDEPSESTPGFPATEVVETTPVPDDDITPVTDRLSWSVLSKDTTNAAYEAVGQNGMSILLLATVEGAEADAAISAEDERLLQLIGQYLAATYALDYGDHFPLFHPTLVEERFGEQIFKKGFGYSTAIARMNENAGALWPMESLTVTLTLHDHRQVTDGELTDYLQQNSSSFSPSMDLQRITAMEKFSVSWDILMNNRFCLPSGQNGFYCYLYDGEWYLDAADLDDDISIDLLESYEGHGYLKTEVTTGTVVAADDTYLYLDNGCVFRIDGAEISAQTDNGDWLPASLRVGSTVSVTHYMLGIPNLSVSPASDSLNETDWTLYTALSVVP